MIDITHVSKEYGNNKVLNDINMRFEEGKIYGIAGENGAGKTTLFRCIAGLEIYEGTITSTQMPLKNYLGLLLTEPYFLDKITGREYIQFVCNARNVTIHDIDSQNVFGLPLDYYASTYSTGMKKKLAITGILCQKNSYFILDEPFNGVDIQSNMIISEILVRLRELGKTIIISSHIFSTLSDICDEIHHLRDGHIIRSVERSEYASLEQEMKHASISRALDALQLE